MHQPTDQSLNFDVIVKHTRSSQVVEAAVAQMRIPLPRAETPEHCPRHDDHREVKTV